MSINKDLRTCMTSGSRRRKMRRRMRIMKRRRMRMMRRRRWRMITRWRW